MTLRTEPSLPDYNSEFSVGAVKEQPSGLYANEFARRGYVTLAFGPTDADPITRIFFDYYRTARGYHPRSVNSTTAWTGTTPMSFFAFPLMTNLDMLAPRKAFLVAGADAHSRYYSEDVQAKAPDSVDLLIVPGADHVDLYDRKDLIPFDRLDEFFTKNLA